jgi:hypothetical protein
VAITRIDRLARGTFDLFAIVRHVAKPQPPVPYSASVTGWKSCSPLT